MERRYTFLGLIGAMTFYILILLSKSLQIFLSKKVFRQLGNISFGIYLLHYPLIGLVSCSFIYAFLGRIAYGKLILASFLLTVLAVVAFSAIFHKIIEQPIYRLIDFFTDFFFNRFNQSPSIDK